MSLRTGNHFINRLARGSTRPMTSIWPMTIHCIRDVSMENADDNCGRANVEGGLAEHAYKRTQI